MPTKTPFLVRPLPYKYESLENYLYRVGNLNGYNGLGWFKNLGFGRSVKLDQINYLYDEEIIETLSDLLLLSVSDIIRLTVQYYRIYDTPLQKGRIKNRWDHARKYCQYCIREKPYERAYWLLHHIKVCPFHYEFLNNCCNKCKKIITFKDILTGVCDLCGTELWRSSKSIHPYLYDELLDKWLENAEKWGTDEKIRAWRLDADYISFDVKRHSNLTLQKKTFSKLMVPKAFTVSRRGLIKQVF